MWPSRAHSCVLEANAGVMGWGAQTGTASIPCSPCTRMQGVCSHVHPGPSVVACALFVKWRMKCAWPALGLIP